MPNFVIEPIFASESDRLLFLSRLLDIMPPLTDTDVSDWETYKLLRPTAKLPAESESEYSERFRLWNEGRYERRSHYILSKYEGYGLGKVKPDALAYLSTHPNPNKVQARQAVLLQLQDKWVVWISNKDVPNELLSLVTGLLW